MGRPLRLLIIEDSPDDTLLLLGQLRRAGYEPEHRRVETAPDFVAALEDSIWDIVIADYSLPQFSAPAALRILNDEIGIDLPFIIVSGTIGEETAVEAMRMGAHDYIMKGNLARLGPAIARELRDAEIRRQREVAQDERNQFEAELQQAQKLEAVGTLASGIAHDFNNLLTAIRAHIDLAKSKLEPDHPSFRSLELVEEAANQAGAVANSLLMFSSKARVVKAPVDVGRVVLESMRLLRRLLPASIDVTDSVPPPNSPAWILGDATQLQQIIMNLAINARDAMPQGGRLRVAVRLVPPSQAVSAGGKQDVVLTVEDTGTGMSPETRARIFEPFFTTKPRGQGTGLGLAVIHGIVSDYGGSISVETRLGGGSRFEVRLPTCPSPEGKQGDKRSTRTARGNGQLVILAEDDDFIRSAMVSTLRDAGYNVTPAQDGKEALDAFRSDREKVGAVVLDVDLPKLSGPQCLREIRAQAPQLPVLIVTGSSDDQTINTMRSRATSVLRKPFQMKDLARAVGNLLAANAQSSDQQHVGPAPNDNVDSAAQPKSPSRDTSSASSSSLLSK